MTASLWRRLALASVSFLATGTVAHAETAPAKPAPRAELADEAPAAEAPHEVVVYPGNPRSFGVRLRASF